MLTVFNHGPGELLIATERVAPTQTKNCTADELRLIKQPRGNDKAVFAVFNTGAGTPGLFGQRIPPGKVRDYVIKDAQVSVPSAQKNSAPAPKAKPKSEPEAAPKPKPKTKAKAKPAAKKKAASKK